MIDQSIINECRKIQLRLLDAFVAVCEKNNLQYWIDFGTLLGAVRYKDFIPWDDDLDVSMPMADYKKFLLIAEKELPRDIFLQTTKTDPEYKQSIAKLCDCYSTFVHQQETGTENYHHGIYIDIFPWVQYPKLPRLVIKVLLFFTVHSRYNALVLKRQIIFNYLKYIICKFFWLLLMPFKTNIYGRTPEDNGYYEMIPKNALFPLSKIEFAGKLYNAPNDVHKFLSLVYGEKYMTPPPENQREAYAKYILPNTPCKHRRAIKV